MTLTTITISEWIELQVVRFAHTSDMSQGHMLYFNYVVISTEHMYKDKNHIKAPMEYNKEIFN